MLSSLILCYISISAAFRVHDPNDEFSTEYIYKKKKKTREKKIMPNVYPKKLRRKSNMNGYSRSPSAFLQYKETKL